MESAQNSKQMINKDIDISESFIQQVKYYIELEDQEALQYLLEQEPIQKLNKLNKALNLNSKEQIFYDSVFSKSSTKRCAPDFARQVLQEHNKINNKRPIEYDSDSEEWENYQKQFKITDIRYGENYSYPYLDLIAKMVSIYIPKNVQGLSTIQLEKISKMVHSQIETLFSYLFTAKTKQTLQKKHRNLNKTIKQYLYYVFEEDYQKYIRFSKLYKNIRKTMDSKEASQKDINKNLLSQLSALNSNQNSQQLNYLTYITDLLSQTQFKEMNKVRSLNFLQFGIQKFKKFIDQNDILPQISNKQVFQLLSFLSCRFLRKILLQSIRKQHPQKKLQIINNSLQFNSTDIKIIGNQLIEYYRNKGIDFLKSDESIEQKAERVFLQEFYQYDYPSFIPKAILQESQKAIQNNRCQLDIKNHQSMQNTSKMNQRQYLMENSTELAKYIWKNYRKYRVLWSQRISAENYFQSKNKEKKNSQKKAKYFQYCKFIEENQSEYDENSAGLWIKYLSMSHFQNKDSYEEDLKRQSKLKQQLKDQILVKKIQGRKKIKLESLDS